MPKISDLLTPEEIAKVKYLCKEFNAQVVEIDGVKYEPPPRREDLPEDGTGCAGDRL